MSEASGYIPAPDTISLDDYCRKFGLTSVEELIEENNEWVWDSASETARNFERDTPEWEAAFDAESERLWASINAAYNKALRKTADYLSELGIKVTFGEDDTVTFSSDNWEEAGKTLLESINGYGMFYYSNLDELIRMGPFDSVKSAVISHLHWHCERGDVFGESSILNHFDRALEHEFRYHV